MAHKYKSTLHVLFQGIYRGIIVILGFIFEKSPECIRISIEVAYHPWCFRDWLRRGV